MKKAKYQRRFLGEIDTSKYDEINKEGSKYANSTRRRFHKKHLRAYLNGQERFKFGKDEENKPVYYEVMFSLEVIPDE